MTKMRFTRQRGEMDCGPVAVANAVKWAGGSCNYTREHQDIKEACDFDAGVGLRGFDRGLRSYAKRHGFKVRKARQLTLDSLKAHLEAGGAAIMAYCIPWELQPAYCRFGYPDGDHICLLTGAKGNSLTAVNLMGSDQATVKQLRVNTIKHMMRDDYAFRCWFLSK